nr:nickel/cobalt transporter [uncultured Halomonas sp.]
MSRALKVLIALVPVLLLLLLAATPSGAALWQWLLAHLLDWQRLLQRGLTMNMMQFSRQADTTTLLTLIGLSLGYGIFHAAGPGHGKAVISTYLMVRRADLSRGVRLTLAAALLQGVVAIALVGVLILGLGMLTREAMASTVVVERISYALVAALGAWLSLRALIRVGRLIRSSTSHPVATNAYALQPATSASQPPDIGRLAMTPSNNANSSTHPPSCHCGHDHHVDPIHMSNDWRESLGVIIAIGLRPCSGAVMILGVAGLLGHWWTGVAAVLAISLGTALTTSTLAVVTVLARRQAQRLTTHATPHWQALLGQGIALCGGLLIMALGIALLIHAPQVATSPMMGGGM